MPRPAQRSIRLRGRSRPEMPELQVLLPQTFSSFGCSVSSVDPATTNHHIVVVKHHGLPRSHRDLRFVERHFRTIVAQSPDLRGRGAVAMTDLHRRCSTLYRRIENPVHGRRRERCLLQRALWSNDHLPILWLECNDVKRGRGRSWRGGKPKPLALTNRKSMDAVVSTDDPAIEIDNRAASVAVWASL